jgi:MFS family permease
MTAEATLPTTGTATALPRRSLGTLIAISIFWFAINLHWLALLTIVIPSQVIQLLYREAPAGVDAGQWALAHAPIAQSLVSAPGLIVALLVNPFFGLLSDRTPGRFGRRRPDIVIGTVVNLAGLALMALAPVLFIQGGSGNVIGPSILVMTGALMVTQLGNNLAAAPFHALLPDLVPQEQRGVASGIMGLAYMLGFIGGAVLPIVTGLNSGALLDGAQSFADFQTSIVWVYAIIGVVVLAMALLTVVTVRETPWRREQLTPAARAEGRHMARDLTLTILAVLAVSGVAWAVFQPNVGVPLTTDSLQVAQLIAIVVASIGGAWAFSFRPGANPDFTWVLLTRLFVMIGINTVTSFILDYMLAVVDHNDKSMAQAHQTLFLVIVLLTGTLSTAFAGWASDRLGRKRVVYLSGAFMAVVGAAFVVAPYVISGSLLGIVLVSGGVFGLGYGAYVAVDWALVADVLPSETTFARDMGVWNINLTVAQFFALVLGGLLTEHVVVQGQPNLGYTLLFVAFVIFCVLGTVTVRFIKGVKR